VSMCIYAVVLERQRWAKARQAIESRELMEQQSANNALLHVFYDVVTELNEALEVCNCGIELASFLSCPQGTNLQGSQFQDMIPKLDDRELFVERMRWPARREEPVADVIHISMGYGGTHSREVEIFSFHIVGLGGRDRHLLGIRDWSSDSAGPAPAALAEAPALPTEAMVAVDPSHDSLPVVGCSAEFSGILGREDAVGSRLSDAVADAGDLLSWIHNVTNVWWNGEAEEALDHLNTFQLVLRPPGPHDVRAVCRVVFPLEEEDEEEEEVQGNDGHIARIRLVLSNLERTQRRERSRGRSRSRNRRRRRAESISVSSSSSSSDRDSQGTPGVSTRASLSVRSI